MEAPGGAGGYEMPIWEACLEDRSPSLVPGGFGSDVAVLIRRLPDFERLVAVWGSELDECLRQAGKKRFWRRQEEGLTRRPWVSSGSASGTPMQEARVELGTNDLTLTDSGLPFGEIWLRVDGLAFPAEGWTDFVVVVLGWWADAAAELLTGNAGPIEVNFMDGPYRARVRVHAESGWNLDLVERGRSLMVLRSAVVDRRLLSLSIIEASERVLERCLKNGWVSTDTARLEVALRRLRVSLLASD